MMKIPNIKTLKFQAFLVTALLVCVLIALLVISVRRSLETNKLSEEYVVKNRIAGYLNEAAGWQAIERGYGATIIGEGKGDSSPIFPKFLEMAKKGDSEVLQIEENIKILLSMIKDETFEDRLSKWRKSYNAIILARLDLAGNSISKDEWIKTATLNINSEFELRNTTFTPQKYEEKILYLNNVIRPDIANLCEYAGLERALIGNAIASGLPFSHDTIKRLKQYRSIMEKSLKQVMVLKELPSTSSRMKQAIKTFEEEFLGRFQPLSEEVCSASKRREDEIMKNNDCILTDQNGFYLHHPNKVKEWGMMELLNKSYHNIRQDYPDEAEQILSGREGSVHSVSGGVIIYRPFFINSESENDKFWVFIKRVKGVEYPVSASAWFDAATKAINTGLNISNIAGEEANAVMLEMRSTARRNILISFILFGFAVFVFIYFLRWSRNRVLKPIQKLTGVAEKIAKGDYSYMADVTSKDEIGTLATGFNKMAGELTSEILKHKQTEKSLRISEERYRELVKNAQDAIICINEHGIVNVWNKAAEKIFGYSEREISGEPITTIIPERYKMQHEEGLRRFLNTSEARIMGRTVEVSGITKEGIEVPIEMSLAFQKNENGNYFFTSIIRDVTERKDAEEKLQLAKEAAEVANQVKSDFLATMSHEIRTPMNGVVGMTDLILDTELTLEQHEYAETIRNSANSLLTVINDILDFSKIEAGKLDMENINFDIRITVDDIIGVFAARIGDGLEFSCFVDPEVPSLLRGDPGRLRQVLINLAGNAIKFTKDGEVTISVAMANETDTHATIRFDVRDTGIGIPADRKNRLFKLFSQVDASITRKHGGTGLGLAISKQIVELMGGQIGVESEEGRGSTFWFTAVLEKQPYYQQHALKELGDIENLRVLIVDDNSTNRYLLSKYLESWHCRVEEAASAKEAMKKLRAAAAADGSNPFQIALLDYCMPEIDGGLLGREIKADPQLKDLILVMLTSVGERGDAERFRRLGFAAYLLKPVRQSQLFDCLRIVTGEHASVGKDTSRPIVTRHTISENQKRRIRILVAEDNIVNQKIAVRLLEKKLFYHADVVANGKEAIDALKRFDYNLVLMDCQMPEMDGYEATRAIRDLNSAVKNHRVPIIAMTANAMKGDREKCLEAGMDDYVSKPINVKELSESIKRHLHDNREH